jgi:hypothetical protein
VLGFVFYCTMQLLSIPELLPSTSIWENVALITLVMSSNFLTNQKRKKVFQVRMKHDGISRHFGVLGALIGVPTQVLYFSHEPHKRLPVPKTKLFSLFSILVFVDLIPDPVTQMYNLS